MRVGYSAAAAAVVFAGSFIAQVPASAQQQQTPLPQGAQPQQSQSSVYDVLMSDPRFTTTMKMVYVAGSSNRLENAKNVTVFAPTNTGWDNSSDEGLLSSLSSTGAGSEFPQSMTILQILRGFFVRGEPTVRTQSPDVQMRSVAQREIEFNKTDNTVKWVDQNGETKSAKVDGQPIMASNGVIYPIDAVVGG